MVIDINALRNGRLPVTIVVRDRKGCTDTLRFSIRVSESVVFISHLTVTNSINQAQVLEWGVANGATTGDGTDNSQNGYLDTNYCEIEIPPVPELDIFDARWGIPTINGVYRNIYPAATPQSVNDVVLRYRGQFHAGGVQSSGSGTNYPVILSWKPASIPAINDATKNPTHSSWKIIDGSTAGNYFDVNMSDVSIRRLAPGDADFIPMNANGEVGIRILDNKVEGFHIIYDWYSGVEDEDNYVTAINKMTPNPANSDDKAILDFTLAKAGYVTIEIFDILGAKVATIENDFYGAGNHTINFGLTDFTGSKLVSGSYQIRLIAGMETINLSFIIIQ
jgi:hypothetical protein